MSQLRNRLNPEEITEASMLYEEKGWKILWIARKFDIDHTSILHLIKKRKLIRKINVLDKRPSEVERAYRQRLENTKEENKEDSLVVIDDFEYSEELSQVKSYRDIVKEASIKRENYYDSECSHPYWTKKCSLCKTILESDSQTNYMSSIEPVKFIYNEFDKLVCPYEIALDLQKLKIKQQSALYWVFFENRNVLTLRIRANIPEITNENAMIASAFTTQELFKLLLRLPVQLKDNSFMNKLALNGDNPTYLGKLLCRSFRKLERRRFRRTSNFKQVLENDITSPSLTAVV
ncbi:MAG TPA: hypothetical protein CFH84_04860 [Sulfurimonas sp. UBA12504]|uniref:Uncharacterized protein n=1 Tax=Candidatus Woesebacteria bacterium GW2011_GWA1_40_45 TaxID=1618554 RepID=A0A0G0SDD4_9BACT|nr:MAG: hypothetical protein UU03_C0019G0002 [Candidatus Woesebacteria bacterium GW2011_GWA1_40_45]DAB30253.1 MAG TPA: hypothetical protein CFH84_04860 [Sulfurimonas sp. UBA12504]